MLHKGVKQWVDSALHYKHEGVSADDLYSWYESKSDEEVAVDGELTDVLAPELEAFKEKTHSRTGYRIFYSDRYGSFDAAQRIVVHAFPYSKLLSIMKLVVTEILNRGGQFQNVASAKVAEEDCFAYGRHDTLIVYVKDRAACDAVLLQFSQWIASGRISLDDFAEALPTGLKKHSKGIAFACEPPKPTPVLLQHSGRDGTDNLSYGRFLTRMAYIGFTLAYAAEKQGHVKTVDDYYRVVGLVMWYGGIDPTNTHLFGPLDPCFIGSIPWQSKNSLDVKGVEDTRLFKAVATEFGW